MGQSFSTKDIQLSSCFNVSAGAGFLVMNTSTSKTDTEVSITMIGLSLYTDYDTTVSSTASFGMMESCNAGVTSSPVQSSDFTGTVQSSGNPSLKVRLTGIFSGGQEIISTAYGTNTGQSGDFTFNRVPVFYAERTPKERTVYLNAVMVADLFTSAGSTKYVTDYAIVSEAITVPALASYTLTFNLRGGTGMDTTMTVYHAYATQLPTTVPTKDGAKFMGWATTGSGSVRYSPGATVSFTANTTLYAVWEGPYTIKFDSNGGTGGPTEITHGYDAYTYMPSTIPTRFGYTFEGWKDAFTGIVYYGNRTSFHENRSATLTAQWSLAFDLYLSGATVKRTDDDGLSSDIGTRATVTGTTKVSGSLPSFVEVEVALASGQVLSSEGSVSMADGDFHAGGSRTWLSFRWHSADDDVAFPVDEDASLAITARLYEARLENNLVKHKVNGYTGEGGVVNPGTADDDGWVLEPVGPSSETVLADGEVHTLTIENVENLDLDSGVEHYHGGQIILGGGRHKETADMTWDYDGSTLTLTFSAPEDGDTDYAYCVGDVTYYTRTDDPYYYKGSLLDSKTVTKTLLKGRFILDFNSSGNGMGIGSIAPKSGLMIGWGTTFEANVSFKGSMTVAQTATFNGITKIGGESAHFTCKDPIVVQDPFIVQNETVEDDTYISNVLFRAKDPTGLGYDVMSDIYATTGLYKDTDGSTGAMIGAAIPAINDYGVEVNALKLGYRGSSGNPVVKVTHQGAWKEALGFNRDYDLGWRKTSPGSSWIAARDNSIMRVDNMYKTSAFYSALSMQTANGYWSLGNIGTVDELYFSFSKDSDYASSNNDSRRIIFPANLERNFYLAGAISDGNYYGLLTPTGASDVWMRSPVKGFIPYSDGGYSSSLGTDGWRWQYVYANHFMWGSSDLISNRTLWSGCYYMNASQTATLNASRSSQPNGVVLVFQPYNGSEARPGRICYFVPKSVNETCLFPLIYPDTGYKPGCKSLGVYDTSITGNAVNANTYTVGGITLSNSTWVLTKVIGV